MQQVIFDPHGLKESRDDENYTPAYVWIKALRCFGADKVDLDPCSNSKENPNVPARRVYTIEDDGLSKDWVANTLWLNPPYSHSKLWTQKLVSEYECGNTKQAIALVKGDFSTRWFQPLLAYPICLVNHRIAFLNPRNKGNSAKFSSAIVYLGGDINSFISAFDTPSIGRVIVAV